MLRVGSLPSEGPAEPHRTLEETPADRSKNPSERQISSESLADDCAPRMVTSRTLEITILKSSVQNHYILKSKQQNLYL